MAKIIKGGGGDAAAPAAPRVPPVIRPGADKKIDREVFSARGKADEILAAAQQAAHKRAAQARVEAEEAEEQARQETSREATLEAVTLALAAYKRRGDALMAAAEDCLAVAGTLVGKITGRPLSLPGDAGLDVVRSALKSRRGRFAAVLHLRDDEVAAIGAHAPLAQALEEHPELRLEASGEGKLIVANGELPLDGTVAMQALCTVLEVEPPAAGDEGAGVTDEQPAADEEPSAEEPPAADEAAPAEAAVAEDEAPADEEPSAAEDEAPDGDPPADEEAAAAASDDEEAPADEETDYRDEETSYGEEADADGAAEDAEGDDVPVRRWTEGTRPNVDRAVAALSARGARRPRRPEPEPPPPEESVDEEPGLVAERWSEEDEDDADERTTMAAQVDDDGDHHDVTDPSRRPAAPERRLAVTRVDETRLDMSSPRIRPAQPEGSNRVATLTEGVVLERGAQPRSDFLDEDDDAPTQANRNPNDRRRSVLPERPRTRLESLPAPAPRSRIPDPAESTRIDVKQPPRKPSR